MQMITTVNLAVSRKSSPVVPFDISEEHCTKYIQFRNTSDLLRAVASIISVHQRSIGVAGVSNKYGRRSRAICVSPATDLFAADKYPHPDENAEPSTVSNEEKSNWKSSEGYFTTPTLVNLLCQHFNLFICVVNTEQQLIVSPWADVSTDDRAAGDAEVQSRRDPTPEC